MLKTWRFAPRRLTPHTTACVVRRQAVVDRTAMFGATTTSARIEDPAAAGWGRHKYVGMFGTHPDYQQRGIGAAVLVRNLASPARRLFIAKFGNH